MAEAKKTTKKADKKLAKKATKPVEKKPIKKAPVKAEKKESKTTEKPKLKEEIQVAKAGKRSAKAIKEAEEKEAKEERRKAEKTDEKATAKPKPVIKARTRLERQGKKMQAASKLIEKNKLYTIEETCELVTKTSPVKFDATVELHVRLGVDPKLSDQNIRAHIVLPNGTGKSAKVAVFAEADKLEAAKNAGADIAVGDEFLQQLDEEKIDFDILIATPTQMAKLAKYARLLGPKGLMPNPKSGTVTANVTKAVKEAKGGKVEYRIDDNGIIHLGVGKISFGKTKLAQNVTAVINSIKAHKPASIKSTYILSIYLTSSMGPSIKVTID